jgi:hypothetical protein
VLPNDVAPNAWRADLAQLLGRAPAADERMPRRAATEFVQRVVLPAFDEPRDELKRHGRDVRLQRRPQQAALIVAAGGHSEFSYAVNARTEPRPSFTVAQASGPAQFGAPVIDVPPAAG